MSPQLPTVLLRAQSDERLVRLVACGSDRAFEALVDRYRRPLLGYARRLAGESRAEDLVQAAFVAAWGELREGREIRDVRAWLHRVVHNNAVNALKRASTSDVPLAGDEPALHADLQREVEQRETVRAALDGIAALPEHQRTALLAVAVQGRRHRDIGRELGVSESAVKMLIHRARTGVRAAATAVTPWPLLAWLAGGRAAEAGAGSAAVSLLGPTAMKTASLALTAGVVATAGPPAVNAVREAVGRDQPAAPAAAVVAGGPSAAPTPAPPGARRVGEEPAPSEPQDAEPQAAEPRRQDDPAAEPPAPPPAPAASPAPVVAAAPAPPAPPSAPQRVDDEAELPGPFLEPAGGEEPAEEEDDWIHVEEEPPDIAAGERPIPLEGVPDDAGVQVNLPDEPAADEDAAPATPATPATPAPPPAAPGA